MEIEEFKNIDDLCAAVSGAGWNEVNNEEGAMERIDEVEANKRIDELERAAATIKRQILYSKIRMAINNYDPLKSEMYFFQDCMGEHLELREVKEHDDGNILFYFK